PLLERPLQMHCVYPQTAQPDRFLFTVNEKANLRMPKSLVKQIADLYCLYFRAEELVRSEWVSDLESVAKKHDSRNGREIFMEDQCDKYCHTSVSKQRVEHTNVPAQERESCEAQYLKRMIDGCLCVRGRNQQAYRSLHFFKQ